MLTHFRPRGSPLREGLSRILKYFRDKALESLDILSLETNEYFSSRGFFAGNPGRHQTPGGSVNEKQGMSPRNFAGIKWTNHSTLTFPGNLLALSAILVAHEDRLGETWQELQG
jgi:hypothetical protein